MERDSYQCNICEKKYSSSKSLRTHKSSHTREITRKAFECQLCGQKFKWQTRYESHFISHVREEEERRSQRAILERGMTELANLARKEDDDRKASQKAHSNHANVETKGSEHGNYSNGEKTRKTNTDDSELGIVTNERCTLDGVKKVEPLETEFQVDESVYKVSARYDSHLIKCIIAEEEKRK